MVLDDLAAQVESYARSLAGGLGGEEGVEDLVELLLVDTDAVVANLQDIVPLGERDGERDFRNIILYPLGFLDDGIDRIVQDTHDSLAEHGGIAVHGHRAVG